MTQGLDESVYPDRAPPEALGSPAKKADYLLRVCGAFDFGVPPEAATVRLLAGWREIFDRFPLPHSPAYHALRGFFGWEPRPGLPGACEPGYLRLDAAEGRTDGFEDRV